MSKTFDWYIRTEELSKDLMAYVYLFDVNIEQRGQWAVVRCLNCEQRAELQEIYRKVRGLL
jgi:hypothetical protein